LHDGGVDHRDLNVRNVLVGPSHSVALIDFDPASVGGPLNLWTRRRRLGRLQRSLLKTIGRSEPTFSLVLEGYGVPGLWGKMQQVSARLMGSVHALLWERA
jgi:tRNA A-37 threonylcarbamoyl transferase component Bud32